MVWAILMQRLDNFGSRKLTSRMLWMEANCFCRCGSCLRLVASHRPQTLTLSVPQRQADGVPALGVGVVGHRLVAASHAELRRCHPSPRKVDNSMLS